MKKTKTNYTESTLVVEAAGWTGVILILLAYGGVSTGLVSSQNTVYQTANCLGAVLLIFHAYKRKDSELVILNAIWAMVAIITIIKTLLTFY